jgi:hypothetical protein
MPARKQVARPVRRSKAKKSSQTHLTARERRRGSRDHEIKGKSWRRFAVEIRVRDLVGSCFPGRKRVVVAV